MCGKKAGLPYTSPPLIDFAFYTYLIMNLIKRLKDSLDESLEYIIDSKAEDFNKALETLGYSQVLGLPFEDVKQSPDIQYGVISTTLTGDDETYRTAVDILKGVLAEVYKDTSVIFALGPDVPDLDPEILETSTEEGSNNIKIPYAIFTANYSTKTQTSKDPSTAEETPSLTAIKTSKGTLESKKLPKVDRVDATEVNDAVSFDPIKDKIIRKVTDPTGISDFAVDVWDDDSEEIIATLTFHKVISTVDEYSSSSRDVPSDSEEYYVSGLHVEVEFQDVTFEDSFELSSPNDTFIEEFVEDILDNIVDFSETSDVGAF